MEQLEFQFQAKGKNLTALDSGWRKNGLSVFDIQDQTGSYVDTVMVHPLDSIEDAVAIWSKRYPG